MLIIELGFDFSYFTKWNFSFKKNPATKVHKSTVVVGNGRMDFEIKMMQV